MIKNVWPPKKFGSIMNIDCDAIAYFVQKLNWETSNIEEKAKTYFNQYLNCNISDIVYNLDTSVPYPVENFVGDRIHKTEEQGVKVDFSECKLIKSIYHVFRELNFDPYKIWLKCAWDNNMRPWISFRMNDVHYANEVPGVFGHTDFFYKAKQNGWMVGDYHHPKSWYGYALDYSIPEVREYYLNIIECQTQEYDCFGVELDYSRTIRCFKKDETNAIGYMTDFIKNIRKILNKAEEKWNHSFKLMVRLSTTIERAYSYGFDVDLLAKEHIVDAFVPTGYWGSTDSDIPIQDWKKHCGEAFPIFWGIEVNTVNMLHYITEDTVAGYQIMSEAAGADALYQYNTFNAPWAWKYSCKEVSEQLPLRRFLTVMNDIPVPLLYGEPESHYLPITVDENTNGEIDIWCGNQKESENSIVFVGVLPKNGKSAEEIASSIKVSIDNTTCEFLGKNENSYMEKYFMQKYMDLEATRYPWRIFAYKMSSSKKLHLGRINIRFESKFETEICYLELAQGK